MNKTFNNLVSKSLRKFPFALLLCAPALEMNAQCVVGGTDFTTETTLCNPTLSNDTLGWFSEEVGETIAKLCKGSFSDVVNNVKHQGLQSNTCLSNGTSDSFEDIATAASGNKYGAGMGVVVGNARVISPYFVDTKSDNLFVNVGTSQSDAFLTYTVSGLQPGSTVSFSCDVWSLLSPDNLEAALFAMNNNSSKKTLITSIGDGDTKGALGPLNFGMQSSGGKLTAGTGRINGNAVKMYVCTEGIQNNQGKGDIESAAPAWGEKETLKLTTKANDQGMVTFTFGRSGGSEFAPIGIDNIKVEGNIEPTIYSQKKLPVCPANPVLLGLKQSFPEGTTFEWSPASLSENGNKNSTFVVTPQDANKHYDVSCKVTMGKCSATAKIDLETKECCSVVVDGKTVPLAETSVFFDDFGTFPDNSTYVYTDQKGVEHTSKVTGGLWTDVTRPFVNFMQDGVKTPDLKPTTNSPEQGWAITNVNPYTPGVDGDASGTKRGGMFIFDLSGGGNANKVVYERTIDGLCKGKEITFGAMFGAINNNPAGVGEMKILLREGSATGKILYEKSSGTLYGNEGWQEAGMTFTLESNINTVVLQVINVTDSYGNSQGDFAIDNISFSVCTPPDVAVDAVLNDGAKGFLDLCNDEIMTLNAQISKEAVDYYGGKPGYLFQYTYDDPQTIDETKVKWFDLSEVQNDGSFTITNPAEHKAFIKIKDGSEALVYFRVVIGEASYLKNERAEWESMSALSPCRAISISSIPIIAGLNCAKCYKPSSVDILDKSDAANLAKTKQTLCVGDKINLSAAVAAKTDEGDPYSGYYLFWKEAGKDISGYTKLEDFAGKGTPAKDLVIENEGKYTSKTTVKYTVIAVDTFEFKSVAAATCKDSAEIEITFLPKPELEDLSFEFCEGLPDQALPQLKCTDCKLVYLESDKATPATINLSTLEAASTAHEFYYYLETEDGCTSDTMLVSVQVNPNPVYEPAEILPFCAGQASPASLKTTVGDSTITWTPNKTDLNELEAGKHSYTYIVEDNNTGCKSKEKNFSVTVNPAAKVTLTATPDCGKTAINAKIDPATATAEWTINGNAISAKTEFVFGTDEAGKLVVTVPEGADYCAASDSVEVELWAVPENPTASDVTCYLKSQESSFKDVQKQCAPAAKFDETSKANEGAELVWRKKGETSWSTTAPTPTVANPSDPKEETIDYEVALRNKLHTSCISEAQPFTVHIYGAPVPLKHDSAYCVGTIAAPLSEYVQVDNTIPNTYELRYYADKDMKTSLSASDVPDTKTPGEWSFFATQYSANGGESEPVEVKITTYGVLEPTVAKTSYEYCSDETAEQLSGALNVKAPYYQSNGVFWKVEGAEQATAPTPAVSASYISGTEEKQTYYAYQKFTIPTTKEVCMGDEVEVNVSFQSTADPTGTFNVGYVYSEFENNKVVDIIKKNSETVDIESGFTYEYLECDNLGNAKPGATWSTIVPKPEDISKHELDANNGSAKRYWLVRRKSDAGKGCYSGNKLITVTISDSPMPIIDPLSYCEGETIDDLVNGVIINESNKKKENYQLLWYTKMPVTPEEQEAGSLTAPATPAATVSSPTEKTVYTYYVAQQDISVAEKPIGTATPFVITVYPNPKQTITDPAAVCGNEVKEVALAPAVSVASVEPSTAKYFEDATGISEIKTGKVSATGVYYAQSSYSVTASNGVHECKSTIDPINVTVETLEIKLAENQQTCPNSKATLGATVATNVENVEFTWTAKVGSDQGGETVTSANGEASASFLTESLVGSTNDFFYYDLNVVADQCKVTKKDISVTLGDGPVVGSLTLTESDNQSSPKVYQNSRSFVSDPFYTCGGTITAVANFEGDADYTWSNRSTGSSVTISGPGIYTIKFTNICATQTTFEVKDAAIKDNMLVISSESERVGEGETLVICEDQEAKFTLNYNAPEEGSVTWTKGAETAYNIKGKTSSISSAKASDSGDYTYTITNHGCTATGTASLKVRPVIVFKPEHNEYIIRRDDNVTIVNNITVPANGVPATIQWMENGASASSDKDYTFAVTEDHEFEIKMSDPDYCDASAKVVVKKDARLALEIDLDEQICRGDKATLTIDTTGTGAFLKNTGHSIVVEEAVGATTRTYASGWRVDGGKLLLEVTPSNNATYTVHFTYDTQAEDADKSIEVLQPIKIAPQKPYNVCAGDEIEIEVDVTSASGNVSVNWNADETIKGALENNSTQTVVPDYEPSLATAFKYKKIYSYVAHMDGCKDKPGQVVVTVDAPIEGELVGDTVCEGQTAIITANYNAAQYVWTVSNVGNPIGQGKVLTYTPEKTALYTVSMSRGNCKKEDTITVTVHSNPKIASVDSLDTRSWVIMVDESYGTNPNTFMYAVDNQEFTYSSQKDSLIFNNHIAYVVDEVGCRDTMPFFVPAPSIKIPNWFSPNGDGDYDYWTAPHLKDIYPNAVVKIYDRWGKLVSEFKGSDLGWDGKYNGNNMPTTDYWYEINVQEIDKIYTGHFTLIRR
ncbi:MAG: T9SS type B sorting domain-containing protein [Bacteroidales bacterium]|nr:T9SS type B sorting domain-containing protein [Candidatus Physcocola equi]